MSKTKTLRAVLMALLGFFFTYTASGLALADGPCASGDMAARRCVAVELVPAPTRTATPPSSPRTAPPRAEPPPTSVTRPIGECREVVRPTMVASSGQVFYQPGPVVPVGCSCARTCGQQLIPLPGTLIQIPGQVLGGSVSWRDCATTQP